VVPQIKTIKLVELNFIFKENALFERKSKARNKFFLTSDLNYAMTQGHPYLRNNDVYLCFIIFCIYTVRYNGSKSKHTRFPQHRYFCKSVFCQSLNSYEHCTNYAKTTSDFYGIIILRVPSFLFPMTYDIGV
jgi:hypothetical protein